MVKRCKDFEPNQYEWNCHYRHYRARFEPPSDRVIIVSPDADDPPPEEIDGHHIRIAEPDGESDQSFPSLEPTTH